MVPVDAFVRDLVLRLRFFRSVDPLPPDGRLLARLPPMADDPLGRRRRHTTKPDPTAAQYDGERPPVAIRKRPTRQLPAMKTPGRGAGPPRSSQPHPNAKRRAAQ